MKEIKCTNLQIDSNMDADDYGHRIVEAISHTVTDTNTFINLIKVKFNDRMRVGEMSKILNELCEAFQRAGAHNCVFVPLGETCGVTDISIDKIEIESVGESVEKFRPTEIYTTYFANLKNLPADVVPISICGKAPDGWKGLQYKKLAPKWSFFKEWKETRDNDFYIKHFTEEVLNPLNAFEVVDELLTLAQSKKIALVCYEKPEDFCHRHLVAEWIELITQREVKEYTVENNNG